MDWIGPTSLYLCNAQIDGIWADSLSAYKLGTPGAVRGAITQDRGSAVAGRIGAGPAEVPVTSHATAALDTTTSATSTTWLTNRWASDPFGSYLAAAAVSVPAYKAADRAYMPGSAETTTTVVVSDGSQEYTVQRVNLWDDPWDVIWTMSGDVWSTLDTLAANPYGIAHADIVSVDFEATLSAARRAATVADASVPGGLHAGANTVTVTFDVYGQPDRLDVPVTLVLPTGTPLEGVLTVSPAAGGDREGVPEPTGDGTTPRRTLAEVVDALNSIPTNDQVGVTFSPTPSMAPEGVAAPGGATPASTEPVSAVASTGLVVDGNVSKPTAGLTLRARPARVFRWGRATISGRFFAANGDTSVRVYRRYTGETTVVQVATVPVTVVDSMGSFAYRTGRLKKAAVFRVVWDGDAAALGATARVLVGLRR
jgi:hypothetical protein